MSISSEYFSYMKSLIYDPSYSDNHLEVLNALNTVDFRVILDMDYNRIGDAIEFRADFERRNGYFEPILTENVSVLEVMVSLAVRCEEMIMANTKFGDRTHIWFWYMVESMNLLEFDDWNFNFDEVMSRIEHMLDRNYEKDGFGSLFYVPNCGKNMKKLDIWYQMQCWLNTIEE